MALTITKNPPTIIAARMPVVFTVETDHTGYCRIKGGISGQTDSIEPDTNHKATFELSDYVKDLPVLNAGITTPAVHAAATAVPVVEFLFSERYGTPPADENEISASNYRVMAARIPYWKHDMSVSIGAWIDNYPANPFITFYPNQVRKVLPAELIHLYYLNTSQYTAHFQLNFDITFTDGSTANFKGTAIEDPGDYDILQFNASPAVAVAWAATNEPTKTVAKYSVKVVCNIGGYTDLSETRTFQVNRMPYSNQRQIVFRNSLGTFDQVMLRGSGAITTKATRITASRQADYDAVQVPDKVTWYNEGRQQLQADTGYLLAPERAWLNELFLSNEIYELQGSVLVPIQLTTEKITQADDDLALMSLALEFEYLQMPVVQ